VRPFRLALEEPDADGEALSRRSQTSVAATPWPQPISSTRAPGRMSSRSTIARSRALTPAQPKKTSAVSNSFGSSSFGSDSASASGTRTISVPRSATIFP
jgi:hypothetical protein